MTAPSLASKIGGVASTAGSLAQSAAAGVGSAGTTEGFLAGMQMLTQETNHVQLEMGKMNLQKTLIEGFAKFIKEMGKGFVMQ